MDCNDFAVEILGESDSWHGLTSHEWNFVVDFIKNFKMSSISILKGEISTSKTCTIQ